MSITNYEMSGQCISEIMESWNKKTLYWWESLYIVMTQAEDYERDKMRSHVDIEHNCWIRVVDSGHPEWIEIASRIYYKGQPWNHLTMKRAKDERDKQKAIKDVRNLQKVTAQLRSIEQRKVQLSSEYGCTGHYPRGMSCPYVFRLYDSIDCRK